MASYEDLSYETPNVLADSAKAWLCELTKTSVSNLEILVNDEVAKAAKEEEQKAHAESGQQEETEDTEGDDELYCTGFAVDTKDKKKLRILTSFRLMEKYEKSVAKIFGDFQVDSIRKAFDFAFLCSHQEDKHRRCNRAEDRSYQTIDVLDVDPINSLVLLEMDVEKGICQEHHHGLKMAHRRPPKGQEFLFRAWPCLSRNVIVWRSVSNNLDRDSKRLFQSRSYNMKLTQFSMKWENDDDETAKDQGVEQFSGSPVIDGNGDCFGVFYGVYDWDGYATALEEVTGFLLKH